MLDTVSNTVLYLKYARCSTWSSSALLFCSAGGADSVSSSQCETRQTSVPVSSTGIGAPVHRAPKTKATPSRLAAADGMEGRGDGLKSSLRHIVFARDIRDYRIARVCVTIKKHRATQRRIFFQLRNTTQHHIQQAPHHIYRGNGRQLLLSKVQQQQW